MWKLFIWWTFVALAGLLANSQKKMFFFFKGATCSGKDSRPSKNPWAKFGLLMASLTLTISYSREESQSNRDIARLHWNTPICSKSCHRLNRPSLPRLYYTAPSTQTQQQTAHSCCSVSPCHSYKWKRLHTTTTRPVPGQSSWQHELSGVISRCIMNQSCRSCAPPHTGERIERITHQRQLKLNH